MSRTDKNGLKVADGKSYRAGRKLSVHLRRGIASSDHLLLVACDLRAVDNCRGITTYAGDNSGDTSFRFVNWFLYAVNLHGKSWIIRSSIGELSVYHVGPITRFTLQTVCKGRGSFIRTSVGLEKTISVPGCGFDTPILKTCPEHPFKTAYAKVAIN